MKKKLVAGLNALGLFLGQEQLCCEAQQGDAYVDCLMQLPSSFIIDRPFIRFFTSVKFKTDEGVIVTGKIIKLSDSKLGFASWNTQGNLIGTASLYTMLPSKDQLYVIRDPLEHVIAYLRVMDVSLLRLFKPVSTLLYSEDGTPLLKSVFSTCGFGFKVFDLRRDLQIPSLVAHKCWSGNIEIQVNHALNIDLLAAVLLLQMQANKTVFENPGDYLHMHFPIHEDDLEHYAMASYVKGVLQKEPNVEKIPPKVCLSAWLDLHRYLKEGAAACELNDDQKNTIVSSLADKFEGPEGDVFPESIVEHLDELSQEEKAVLCELIESRLAS